MIELQNVSKRYVKDSTTVHALADVNIRIDTGEFVAIVGPSGSGKSTLMNTLGLLDRADEGTYLLENQDVSGFGADQAAAVRNERIGFVFQSFHLLPKTPALENVELPLIYSSRSDIAGLGMAALEKVGLTDRAHHVPSELSGGQQQRVAIARALINDPALILADEPTGNLDTESGGEIMATFQELNRKGKTIVLITHDRDVAAVANRTIRMVDGRIVADEGGSDQAGSELSAVAVADGKGGHR
jgi:ABC-type lipoprotein export system ATPase subunit